MRIVDLAVIATESEIRKARAEACETTMERFFPEK